MSFYHEYINQEWDFSSEPWLFSPALLWGWKSMFSLWRLSTDPSELIKWAGKSKTVNISNQMSILLCQYRKQFKDIWWRSVKCCNRCVCVTVSVYFSPWNHMGILNSLPKIRLSAHLEGCKENGLPQFFDSWLPQCFLKVLQITYRSF